MSTGTTDSGVSIDWHLPPKERGLAPPGLLFFAPASHSATNSRPASPLSHARSISSPPSLSLSSPSLSPDPEHDDDLKRPASPTSSDDGEEPAVQIAPRPMSLTYGISAVGRGFDWRWADSSKDSPGSGTPPAREETPNIDSPSWSLGYNVSVLARRPVSATPPPVTPPPTEAPEPAISAPLSDSPPSIPVPFPTTSTTADEAESQPPAPAQSTPSSPRPRRRDSQKRISLVAGRLSMISIQPPPSPPPRTASPSLLSPRLNRFGSNSSALSIISTGPPSRSEETSTFNGIRNIDQFVIDGEAGRGAYGVVKRARERLPDGTLGPPLILKQVVKSRILADCWKKHPRLGTIPIEIYVMSAISNTPYTLPYPRRPWDPQRAFVTGVEPPTRQPGETVLGHPGICRLIDFWEDPHFYYLMLPNARPTTPPSKDTPGDLFDLVEVYPHGLPPHLVRSYLGQLADAMAFLHSKGIVHRDIKDENVVLGEPDGACVLIDFGSSGVVRRAGWDTFSGTLDYAAPEILEGARYMGKEQDVWAFGVVAFVLLVGECPFASKAEAHAGLGTPTAHATPPPPEAAFLDLGAPSNQPTKSGRSLDARCSGIDEARGALDRALEGLEPDGGGALGDAAALVRACLHVSPADRPTFEDVMRSRFLSGSGGWSEEWVPGWSGAPASSPDELLSPQLHTP